ncbi:MAG: hypothetical protein ACOC9T_00290 [Myxococcota bacterium]
MADDALPLDTWDMTHIEARRRISELPADADFQAIRDREEAREKGPRPSVVAALEERLSEGEREDTGPGPAPTTALDEATWTEHEWRGHTLYKCRYCPGFQTFDIGRMYQHARRKHPNG